MATSFPSGDTALPHILISNDDGYLAPGLLALVNAIRPLGRITVIAPEQNHSGASNSLTLSRPLSIHRIAGGERDGFVFINGTPTDCVHIAMTGYLDHRPDLVVSGINHGPNIGVDVLYSGTVSAAMEAMLMGYPAIATSLYSYSSKKFEPAAKWVRAFLEGRKDFKILPERTFLNINFPPGPSEDYKGVEVTVLGNRAYKENFEERVDPRGRSYYWLAGDPVEDKEVPGTDGYALLQNKISITPVKFDMTNYNFIEDLKGLV